MITVLMAVSLQVADLAPSDRGVILWQTLREGMTVDEAAAGLRSVEGVRSVTVKTLRKGQALSISYAATGIDVSGLLFKVVPDFNGNRLSSVRLQTETCLGLAIERYKGVRDLLAQKYGAGRTQREVTEDRQLVAIRDTFSTAPTRVLLRLEPGDVPKHIYGATGIAGAVASIANSVVDTAIEACPNDAGQKASIEVTYLNNANSAAIDAAATAEAAARRERDKRKL